MVNRILALLIVLLSSFSLGADFANSDIFVTSNIDEYRSSANQPLNGTITVTHDKNEVVDTSSFLIGKVPVKVEFVQDVKISSNSPLVISYYHFQMPAQPPGLYMLPEATVVIGGKQYHSIRSSYEVQDDSIDSSHTPSSNSFSTQTNSQQPKAVPKPSAPIPSSSMSAQTSTELPSKIILKLEADTGSNKQIYPGQKLTFVYRYFYNTNISLTKEQLPLLEPEGFLKFGDKESKDYTENNMSVREISQTVEAIKPGTFTFGPSVIEGYAYTQNSKGQPAYSSSKLVSEVPELSVTVLPFPDKNKPAFFNGAVGEFDFAASLASTSDIHVGDEIRLNIDISSKGDSSGVSLPDISKQPGFPGFFRMSDLPPVGSVKDGTKHFEVIMRPLVAVKEIPSIAFSFFNPKSGEYTTLKSKPISLSVSDSEKTEEKSQNISKKLSPSEKPKAVNDEAVISSVPKPIEIQGIFNLQAADLYNKMFGTWWALGVIPFALALYFYQKTLRDYLERIKNEVRPETSQELYHEFLQKKKGTPSYYELLNRFLKLKLLEMGKIKDSSILTEDLPITGVCSEVRTFLNEIDEKRFSKSGELILAEVESKAEALMNKMEKMEQMDKEDVSQ